MPWQSQPNKKGNPPLLAPGKFISVPLVFISQQRGTYEVKTKKKNQSSSKRKTTSPLGKVANSAMNSIGREVGKSIGRGLLGTLKKLF